MRAKSGGECLLWCGRCGGLEWRRLRSWEKRSLKTWQMDLEISLDVLGNVQASLRVIEEEDELFSQIERCSMSSRTRSDKRGGFDGYREDGESEKAEQHSQSEVPFIVPSPIPHESDRLERPSLLRRLTTSFS